MADLGTINSFNDNHTGVVVRSFGEDYITTSIINSVVNDVAGVQVSTPGTTVYVTQGDGSVPSLLSADKGNFHPLTSLEVHVASIEFIVPGPIANIEYGFNLGKEQSTIKVPRVYPPIYIEPRSRNA